MLEALITSKTRIKLLLKFFLNPNTSAYLRGLASEFGESSNAVRLELNRLEEAGMLESSADGNKKMYKVNNRHPLFNSLQQIVRKYIGIDQIIENILKGLGNLERVYLAGGLAKGSDVDIIDLIIIGDVDRQYLSSTVVKVEQLINRKIQYVIYEKKEAANLHFSSEEHLLIWTNE